MHVSRIRWWHLTADESGGEEGISLVEVIIATFILSVALLALASVGTTSLISLRLTRDREQATNAASAALESARARDFADLALAGNADPSSLPPDIRSLLDADASCAGGEALVRDAASSNPVPLTTTAGTNDAHTVYTVVTWADETDCSTTSGALKRVTTLATWRDRGQLGTVRQETLVAPAGRGLPVPNFEVKPPEARLRVTPAQVAAETERCLEHQLRNIGAEDGYGWEVTGATRSGSTTNASPFGSTGWSFTSAGWRVEAYLEPGEVTPRQGVPPSDLTAKMNKIAGEERPVSNERIEPRERATVTFCYKPTPSAQSDVTVNIDVVSRFDERRTEPLVHHLEISTAQRELYLQDRDDTTPHTRWEPGNGNQEVYRPQPMNELNPDSLDRSQLLGVQTGLDWSTELTPSLPGVMLVKASNPNPAALKFAEWRHGFAQTSTVLSGNAYLKIWTSPTSVLSGGGPSGQRVHLRVELDAINQKENTNNRVWPEAGPITTEIDYQHGTADGVWSPRTVQLPIPASRQFSTNERLRLRVTCLSTSTDNCNIAYDTTTHPGHLQVAIQ